jgi:hypothetical protein
MLKLSNIFLLITSRTSSASRFLTCGAKETMLCTYFFHGLCIRSSSA